MRILDRLRGNSDHETRERKETRTTNVTRSFKVYRVKIDYGDRTRIERVTKYTDGTHKLKLYDQEPYIITHYNSFCRRDNIPTRPKIRSRDGEPLIISLANVEDIDISVDGEYVFVCQDVEYTQVLRQHTEGGEWEEAYTDFEKDGEYDIEEWMRSEWEAC